MICLLFILNIKTMKKKLAWTIAISSIIVISSCHKSELSPNASNVMLVNGGPDSSVDVELTLSNGSIVVPMTDYLSSLGYQYVIPGADNFDILNSSDTTSLTFSAALVNGGYYSVFTCGSIQKSSAFIVTDKLVIPSGNNASVRLVNTCPDTGAASIAGNAVSTSGNTTFGSNVAYKTASDFTTLSAGVYALKVTSSNPANERDTSSVQFSPGKIYTIMYAGTGPTYSVTVISNN